MGIRVGYRVWMDGCYRYGSRAPAKLWDGFPLWTPHNLPRGRLSLLVLFEISIFVFSKYIYVKFQTMFEISKYVLTFQI